MAHAIRKDAHVPNDYYLDDDTGDAFVISWSEADEAAFIDTSVCCVCGKINEYAHPANVTSGWRCTECRIIRSML